MDILERYLRNVRQVFHNVNVTLPINKINDAFAKSASIINSKPLTKDNVLFYYCPIQGVFSYGLLSVNVMNPHIMTRLFPRGDITNVLLLGASGGAGLWLWSRPHLAAAAPMRRFSWAFVGASLWSLGSILMWAILRSSVGRRPVLGTAIGILSGAAVTQTTIDYFHYVELIFCGDVHLSEDIIYDQNSDDEKYDIDL